MRKLRLFWAVNLPEDFKAGISEIQTRLKNSGSDSKWVDPHNLHITVKFLGETDGGMVGEMAGAVAERLKGCGEFRLALEGLGFFPGAANPRVLWAGLKGDVGKLKEIAAAVDQCMSGLGFPREGRKFSPHLTLARLRSSKNMEDLIKGVGVETATVNSLGGFSVLSVDLMQSDLNRQGPVYSVLKSVRLAR
ncbi:MAG: RNA 2',3'-cyclic phosphodiesterase [Bacillota bacterium]